MATSSSGGGIPPPSGRDIPMVVERRADGGLTLTMPGERAPRAVPARLGMAPPQASPPQQPPPSTWTDRLRGDPRTEGMVLVDHHPEHETSAYYNVPRACRDVHQATLNSKYFSLSAYALLAFAFALRVFSFFAALFIGTLPLAEIMLIFVWVELAVALLVWSRWLGLLYVAFFLMLLSFLAKGLYLAMWTLWYWNSIDMLWWWIVAGTVGGYALVAGAALFSIANIKKAKLAFCVLWNDMERLAKRKEDKRKTAASRM